MKKEIKPIEGINPEAWGEWVAWRRKEKGNPVGEGGAKKQFNVLLQYSHDAQQEIIDTSMNGGWTGLFHPKGKQTFPPAEEMTHQQWLDGESPQERPDLTAIAKYFTFSTDLDKGIVSTEAVKFQEWYDDKGWREDWRKSADNWLAGVFS